MPIAFESVRLHEPREHVIRDYARTESLEMANAEPKRELRRRFAFVEPGEPQAMLRDDVSRDTITVDWIDNRARVERARGGAVAPIKGRSHRSLRRSSVDSPCRLCS